VSQLDDVGQAFGPLLGSGLARPIGFGRDALLRYVPPGPGTDYQGSRWGGQKVIWVIGPSYDGPVLVRGRQLDGPNAVGFTSSADAPNAAHPFREMRIPAGFSGAYGVNGPWRDVVSATRLLAPGCYAYQIDTLVGSTAIVFRAEGPRLTG
jgi:hypothetical protein